jgi:hypothetical protein
LKIDHLKKIDPSQPLEIEVTFENKNHISKNSKTFCKSCFALDPRYPRSLSVKVGLTLDVRINV